MSLWLIFFLSGCKKEPANRVVLYCSVDDVYARPIVRELEKQTGLKIDVLYDVEAAKTAGLANRIRAEKNRPHADVFWSSALLQTLLLKREGLLQEYSSPSAKDIPAAFKDKDGFWTGMGVRSRVIMFSMNAFPGWKNLTPFVEPNQLPDPGFKGHVGISNPQFGTASDWAAVLAVRWGKKRTLDYFRRLKKSGVRVLPGNSVVAEKIVRGELLAGVTDSDDFLSLTHDLSDSAKSAFSANSFYDNDFPNDNEPLPNQPRISGVFIPGSVAVLKNAPHRSDAQKLVNALLSPDAENSLVRQMPGVVATRQFRAGRDWRDYQTQLFPHSAQVPNDTDKWAESWDEIREPLAQILLSD